MNINLSPELEKMVNEKVASGVYASASEVIRTSLRMMMEHDQTHQARLEALRRDVQKGFDQIDRGSTLMGKNL